MFELKHTPFHERTSKLSVPQNWRRWAGHIVLGSYDLHLDREYRAIRDGVAMIDVSPLMKYMIEGPDAARLLHKLTPRDVHRMAVGQVGYTGQGEWQETSFAGQFRQALQNVLEVLAQAGGRPEHLVRLTWYVLDKAEYLASLKDVGAAYRELMGKHYPVMAVVQVSGLVEDQARLEIEATAVVP